MEILVIGCGIIGLSSGISLLRQNGKYKVTIVAKDLPPNVTSNKAAAVWFPYLAHPADKIGRWSNYTLDYLKKEAKVPNSGVILQRAVELYPENPSDAEWTKHVPLLEKAGEKDKPKGYENTHGFAIEGAVADTDHYMNYLVQLFSKLGGKIIQKEITNLDEVFKRYNVVINCSGLGARELVNDNTIYPTRGQTVVVKNKTFATTVMYEGHSVDDIVYIVPRTNTTVLGGTAQENNWNLNPDENDTKNILRKAAVLRPEFKDVEVVQVKVGLRPTRPTVRVELEKRVVNNETKLLIHNYGHGGSGFTIGWGCAMDVVGLVEDNIHQVKQSSKL